MFHCYSEETSFFVILESTQRLCLQLNFGVIGSFNMCLPYEVTAKDFIQDNFTVKFHIFNFFFRCSVAIILDSLEKIQNVKVEVC